MIGRRLREGISTPRDNVNDGGRWSCALQMSHAVVVERVAGSPAVVHHDRAAGRPSCHVVERSQQTSTVKADLSEKEFRVKVLFR
ncbi:Hypothetical protein CINCED_3A003060 [Cinara cedri]|uniref:Uncharacterized protein n=1 Tax=Cinara cedri TaxID=506608 RepID=A0A5E4NAC7_9HEMI|nr:Hypothetical protein CINCED_3A003060 [Cinara cedri]